MVVENAPHNRILYIDFLKFVGLMCIILAHVNPPEWLFMLRNFDVQLMVIISSMLGQTAFQKFKSHGMCWGKFCINRAKRLVYPTWIFLIIMFVFLFLTGNVYSDTYYLYSFLLTRYGIGYVWIILIYLYSALLIPLCDKAVTIKRSWIYVIVIYLAYEIICYFKIGANNRLVDSTIYYIIPYGLLTYLGFNYRHFSAKVKVSITAIAAITFCVLGIFYWKEYGAFQDVQIAKYSPKAYYLSYGVLVSFTLLSVCEKMQLKLYSNKIVAFTAKHSMWIYLWHILALKAYEHFGLPDIWYIKFIVVFLVSLIIVVCVNRMLDIIDKGQKCSFLRYLRG